MQVLSSLIDTSGVQQANTIILPAPAVPPRNAGSAASTNRTEDGEKVFILGTHKEPQPHVKFHSKSLAEQWSRFIVYPCDNALPFSLFAHPRLSRHQCLLPFGATCGSRLLYFISPDRLPCYRISHDVTSADHKLKRCWMRVWCSHV